MGTIGQGHFLFLQMGKQGGAGTAVAATGARMELISFSSEPVQGSAEDPSMVDLIAGPRDIIQLGRYYSWNLKARLSAIGQLKLWEMMQGNGGRLTPNPAATTADGNGILTFTFADGPLLSYYTMEVQEGQYGGVATVTDLQDCVCEQLKLTCEASQSGEGAFWTLEASGYATIKTVGQVAASLTTHVCEPLTFKHVTTLADGLGDTGVDFDCRRLTLTLNRVIEKDAMQMSTLTALPAIPGGKFTALWEMEYWFQKDTLRAALEAWTNANLDLLITGPDVVGATGRRSLQFKSTKARVISCTRPVDVYGYLRQVVQYKAYDDNGTPKASFTIVNKNESASISAG